MAYSCVDFVDSILDALKIDVPEEDYENPSAQADLALAEIERLQKIEGLLCEALPWVEEEAKRPAYKPGAGAVLVARIRAAIEKKGGE